ncbi:MAG TPA: squalene cyclase [Arthrobacter sp.]|nr:squalene cyclase [Arthrobacter sp.]
MERQILDWLVDSDPSLRWQVERDLLGVPDGQWRATRSRVATEGFGARLLELQDADGQWAGGAYFPGDFDHSWPEAHEGGGQPWTATTWSLNALRGFGLDPQALSGTADRLAVNSRWEYDNLPYWGGEVDCCINSWTLSNGLWLGADVDGLVDWFLEHQLPDGGWNCAWVDGSTRSSFHSTLNSLEGLLDYQLATGDAERVRRARDRAEEYLLVRGLFRRLSTGEDVASWVAHFAYPFRWFYSVLRAADYFRAASRADGTPPDPRLAEAVGRIRDARQPDGTWLQERRHPGSVWFEIDVEPGQPSPWLTFHALRVLEWWDAAAVRSS